MNMNLLDVNLGGGYVLQYANRYKYQMMGYLVETPDKKTLMIDSGQPYEEDAMYLYSLLCERNKKVDTWIITHAHDDHFGSLMYLMENLPQFDIEIGELYFDFPDTEWLLTVEGGNRIAKFECEGNFFTALEDIRYAHCAVEQTVLGMHVQMNKWLTHMFLRFLLYSCLPALTKAAC